MKRIFFAGILFCAGAFYAFSQSTTLEQAIRDSARDISQSLPGNTRVAVLNFTSPSVIMTDHVLEELNDAFVNDGNLTVLDRRNLGMLQHEMNFQLSGYVSDETQQAIGRMLGAEVIVSGSLGVWGNEYQRFRIQVLIVETGALYYSRAQTVRHDYIVETLLTGEAPERDFSTAERVEAIALNLFFGLGSFAIQRDRKSGFSVLIPEVIGIGATAFGLFINWAEDKGYTEGPASGTSFIRKFSSMWVAGGIATYSFGMILGTIRVIYYQRPGSFASLTDPGPWSIAMVPDAKGDAAIQLSYSMHF